jgi:uncharacterized protein YbbC (DUF1343 family)
MSFRTPLVLLYLFLLCFFLAGMVSCSRRRVHTPVKPSEKRLVKPVLRPRENKPEKSAGLVLGASQFGLLLPELAGKRVGLVVNHTSRIAETHLVDTLLRQGVKVMRVFAPEHGFRGDTEAGAHIQSSTDSRTGLPLVSLYGASKKPSPVQLRDLDLVVFNIQDVGTRFYTYISTMHYVMEACAENKVKVLVLDRPNPNGSFVDGPLLEPKFRSFVGMHPIPVLHGLTVGELANMVNGEGWLAGGIRCDLKIIPMKNYVHSMDYELPISPSPNLPNQQAIRLYPSVCFFEGTRISLGRGTDFPFQVLGAPDAAYGSFKFTPVSTQAARKPPFENQTCYGIDLRQAPDKGLTLKYLLDFYQKCPDKSRFFIPYFDTLAGTDKLRKQIEEGKTEVQIRSSWEPDLIAYKVLRKRYLLYPE